MKRLFLFIYIFISIFIILTGCDYGLDSGSDLIGYCVGHNDQYEFYDNNFGYRIKLSPTDSYYDQYFYFKYKVKNTTPYNTILMEEYSIDRRRDVYIINDLTSDKIKYIEENYDSSSKLKKCEYYFSYDKKYIYIRRVEENCFLSYEKYGNYYY